MGEREVGYMVEHIIPFDLFLFVVLHYPTLFLKIFVNIR